MASRRDQPSPQARAETPFSDPFDICGHWTAIAKNKRRRLWTASQAQGTHNWAAAAAASATRARRQGRGAPRLATPPGLPDPRFRPPPRPRPGLPTAFPFRPPDAARAEPAARATAATRSGGGARADLGLAAVSVGGCRIQPGSGFPRGSAGGARSRRSLGSLLKATA